MPTFQVYKPDPSKVSNVKVTRVEAPKRAPASNTERSQKHRMRKKEDALENIAILDMETDPFDKELQSSVDPFLAVLYSDNFEPIVIWEENREAFVEAVHAAILGLPGSYVIYAHNGGKFDFMFLISKLRGEVSFKGRGIMSAKIGEHELRDSFHIINEKLASYAKDAFDYANMGKAKRNDWRKEIIDYCIADCRYLLDIVKGFIGEFGFKISVGQAAMSELKKVVKFDSINAAVDADLRKYFFGGRVECLQGRMIARGHYKLYDVNSMYPAVMANFMHPIGKEYTTRQGEPGPNTFFLDITCDNYGALVCRDGNGDTTATEEHGRFFTTIHEYNVAVKYGLIENVTINFVIDCDRKSDFSAFVVPRYERRLAIKQILKDMKKAGKDEGQEWLDRKKDDLYIKFILNNAYGKFAQNPRKYKETYFTDPGDRPPQDLEGYGELPVSECRDYWIWERPAPKHRFNNVGTAASITGAARSVLLEAIQLATDPIYCDTDSLICRDLSEVHLDGVALGAWDVEAEYSEVIVNGKKMYACKPWEGGGSKEKIRSKGVQGLSYSDMLQIYEGDVLRSTNFGPTLTKTGRQYYVTRNVRATAQLRSNPNAGYKYHRSGVRTARP